MIEKKPITDGQWWYAKSGVWIKCDRCGRLHRQRPAVMKYVPDMDFGEHLASRHPGISQKGWMLWGWCTKRQTEYFEVVSEGAIHRWDTQVSGWRTRTRGESGYLP